MRRTRPCVAATLALAALAAVSSCAGPADKAGGTKAPHVAVLHLLNTRGVEEVQPFIDKATQLSTGALRFNEEFKWNASSTSGEADAIRAIQTGQADLAIVPARAWHSAGVTSFDALLAPLAIDSMALQHKVLESDLPQQMLAGLTPLGLVGIGILPGPMRKPAGITRTLLAPSDYQGARIATSPSTVGARALRTLGATPVDSTFEGADMTSFDAIELNVAGVAGNDYDGVVKTVTANLNLWPRPLVIFTSAKTMRRLSDQQLRWLRSAARAALDATTQRQLQFDTDGLDAMCHRGKLRLIAATPEQAAQLRAAFRPVYAWLQEDQQTRGFLDRIEALRRDGGVAPYPQESLTCAGV